MQLLAKTAFCCGYCSTLTPGIGAIGFSYLNLHEGKVEVVTPDERRDYGTYTKEQARWVWTTHHGDRLYLIPSGHQLRILSPDGGEEPSFSRSKRLLLPPPN